MPGRFPNFWGRAPGCPHTLRLCIREHAGEPFTAQRKQLSLGKRDTQETQLKQNEEQEHREHDTEPRIRTAQTVNITKNTNKNKSDANTISASLASA